MITILYIFSKHILWLSHGLACEILVLARAVKLGIVIYFFGYVSDVLWGKVFRTLYWYVNSNNKPKAAKCTKFLLLYP